MLNDVVSIGNTMAGRMISGLVALSMDHPFALACILAALMGAAVAVLLDAVGPRRAYTAAVEPAERPPAGAGRAAGQPRKTPRQLSAEP